MCWASKHPRGCEREGITGNPGAIDPAHFEMLSGVAEAIRVSKPYKLVGRDLKQDDTIVRVGDVEIGGSRPAIIAGPCAVESYEQTMAIAEIVASCGVIGLRAWRLFEGQTRNVDLGVGPKIDGLTVVSQAHAGGIAYHQHKWRLSTHRLLGAGGV